MYQVFFVAIWILRRAGASLYRSGLRGNVENRHGIILAKNQLTKVTGGKTGEAIWQAQGNVWGRGTTANISQLHLYPIVELTQVPYDYTDLLLFLASSFLQD